MLNNFIYAQSKAMFEERLHEVPSEAIVFIEDTKEIWNHGHYFAGEGVDVNSGKYLPIEGGTCTGAITATAFYQSSDETLKVFGDDISIDFNALKRIPKKYFNWKDGDGTTEIGTGAQSLQKVYPELVTESNGHLVVAYDKLSIIALKAIDVLHAENQELKNRLTKLEEMVYGNRN